MAVRSRPSSLRLLLLPALASALAACTPDPDKVRPDTCCLDDTQGPGDSGETGETGDPDTPPAAVWGIPNIDDDDSDGTADWEQRGAASGDDDLARLLLPEALRGGHLVLSDAGSAVRIWHQGTVLVGETATGDLAAGQIPAGAGVVELAVEFETFLSSGSLEVQAPGGGETWTVRLLASPLATFHHLEAVEELWVLTVSGGGTYNNTSMVSDLQDILGEDVVTTVAGMQYDWDVWMQDEFELASLRAPDSEGTVVIDSIRSSNGDYLDPFPENVLEGPDVTVRTWGRGLANSLDSFGNLETSPPVTVDGVDYPLGRIYFGAGDRLHPSEELMNFLSSQRVQEPFWPDTTWLCVGHVDEYMTFVPDPSSEKGFKMVFTDTDLAWSILDGMDPEIRLSRYSRGHGYDTVGEIVGDAALRAANEDIQRDHLDPLLAEYKAELGLTDDDVILIPGIFEESRMCGGLALALIPGIVNMTIATVDGTTHLLMPDPFLREDEGDQGDDPFIAAVDAVMPAGLQTWYIDNWYVYHLGWGEVHCGTNVRRVRTENWWTTATHLLEGAR